MRIAWAALAVFVAGCVVPPFELNPTTPNLNITAADKRPAKVAIVVQDPMAYSLLYQGQGGYTRDMTAESRAKGFQLEKDLAKIAEDTLSQEFSQVVVMRELPPPGQYDAVVSLAIGRILMKEDVKATGERCDVTAAWTMSVLDRGNKEILARDGISPSHSFDWSILSPSRGFVLGIDSTMSAILGELSQEWGSGLRSLDLGPRS